MSSWLTGFVAALVLMSGIGLAAAAASVPRGEPPGRERFRFIDPPGAQLLQPQQPGTILPWEATPSRRDCRLRVVRGKQRWQCPRRH